MGSLGVPLGGQQKPGLGRAFVVCGPGPRRGAWVEPSHARLHGTRRKVEPSHARLHGTRRKVERSHARLHGTGRKVEPSHARLHGTRRQVEPSHARLRRKTQRSRRGQSVRSAHQSCRIDRVNGRYTRQVPLRSPASRWRLGVRALARPCLAGKAPSPMQAPSMHSCVSGVPPTRPRRPPTAGGCAGGVRGRTGPAPGSCESVPAAGRQPRHPTASRWRRLRWS